MIETTLVIIALTLLVATYTMVHNHIDKINRKKALEENWKEFEELLHEEEDGNEKN